MVEELEGQSLRLEPHSWMSRMWMSRIQRKNTHTG
jgi:hypothetical protein